MNQRILLPAVVIGTLFAALLTFIETRLPVDDPLIAFAVNAAALLLALGVYGYLMQKAAAVTAAAAAAAGAEASPQRAPRPARAKASASPAAASGERTRGGRDQGGRNGGRGNDRKAKRDAPAEADTATDDDVDSGPREQGTIKWFSGTKGYGFIIRGDGSEVFVHHRAIRGQARGDIPDGQPVSFVIVDRDKGPQADQVQIEDGSAAKAAGGNRA